MVTRTISPFDRGGIQRHVAEISKALSREGIEVHLFIVGKAMGIKGACYPGTPLQDSLIQNNIHVHPVTVLPTPRLTLGEYFTYSINAARRVKGFELDLIHGQSMYSFGCALKKRYPLVVTIQGPQIVEYKTELGSKATMNHIITDAASVFMEAYAARKADRLIVDSEGSRKTVVESYGVDEKKTRVIVKEGVDLEQFTPSLCESNTLLFVGRLHERKGLDLFLPIFKEILKERDAVLKIVGSGEKEKALKQQAEKLDLKEHVKFLGFLPDSEMRKELSSASIFVSPSRYEGFGITLLEAMASGLPLVSTETGIAGEVVKEGDNGFLVNYDNIGEAVIRLLVDESLRKRMGTRSREMAKSYTWEDVARKMIAIYKELV
jgi:glycosyltransferase involved in cell wall biosynthesis